jgi:hypothetical protein
MAKRRGDAICATSLAIRHRHLAFDAQSDDAICVTSLATIDARSGDASRIHTRLAIDAHPSGASCIHTLPRKGAAGSHPLLCVETVDHPGEYIAMVQTA